MDKTRREALGLLGAALAGGAAALVTGDSPAQAADEAVAGKRWGMLIDTRRCIGCKSCAVACKAENDVPLGVFRRRVRTIESGEYPNAKRGFVSLGCFHCESPKCVKACPKKAITKNPEGYVIIDKAKCRTKKRCIYACPYRNIFINPVDKKAEKCTFCMHRVNKGVAPACVQTCTGEAIMFGDLNDANSDIAKVVKKGGITVLKPEAGTKPSVGFLGMTKEVEKGILAKLKKRGQIKPIELEGDR